MNDAGYTLAEVLAALFILGLATGGLVLTTSVLGRLQWKVSGLVGHAQSARAAQSALSAALSPGAPYRPQDPGRLVGEPRSLRYACDEGALCQAALQDEPQGVRLTIAGPEGETREVRMPGGEGASFLYHTRAATLAEWPPADPAGEVLRGVSIVATAQPADRPLVHVRLWNEQPLSCAFDVVVQDCR